MNLPQEVIPTLVIVPSGGAVFEDQRVLLDEKALSGLMLYAKYWPGRVRCLYRQRRTGDMSYATWRPLTDLPFELRQLSPDARVDEIAGHTRDAAVVLLSGDNHRDLGAVATLAEQPVVFIIENTLKNRLDILRLEEKTVTSKLRIALWLLKIERSRRRDLARAAGIQANGMPAFKSYGSSNGNPLLFFDTRLSDRDAIHFEQVERKISHWSDSTPLRLVYSGRLERLKGANYLVPTAALLRDRGNINFSLDIFGDGSLQGLLKEQIARLDLQHIVTLHGPVDFETMLVPYLKTLADLFLCCHPQGDPSCTYLETLGCGVPIIGFLNDAFRGVLSLGPCGEGVKIGDRDRLVEIIEKLGLDHVRLAELTRGAAHVASNHLFEKTLKSRVAHLVRVAGLQTANVLD